MTLIDYMKINNLKNGFVDILLKQIIQIFILITSNYEHAKQYSEINKLSYGGDFIIDEITILNNPNLLDLNSYDMDEKMDMYDIECFLEDYDIKYDYEDLFDISENMIPFSRLVNNIIDKCYGI